MRFPLRLSLATIDQMRKHTCAGRSSAACPDPAADGKREGRMRFWCRVYDGCQESPTVAESGRQEASSGWGNLAWRRFSQIP
jgi:hypothetical protein